MFERIIVPMDGSRISAEVLPFVVDIAKNNNSEVVLLRVVSKMPIGLISQTTGVGNPNSVTLIAEQAQSKEVDNAAYAKRYLSNHAKFLKDQGINAFFEVMEGSPARCIMDFANSEKTTLIIMMSHGRGRFKRAILGSVTDAVIRGTTVPVLVIRPKEAF